MIKVDLCCPADLSVGQHNYYNWDLKKNYCAQQRDLSSRYLECDI